METFERIFSNGYGFEHFIGLAGDLSHENETKKFLDQITMELDPELKEAIRGIKGDVRILAFAEAWCSDCRINMPAVEMIETLSDAISFRIVGRSGHEEYIVEVTGREKAHMPTIVVLRDGQMKGVFVERPLVVRAAEESGDEAARAEVMTRYRKGRCMNDTIRDLLGMIG
jgi:hypothetical protein